MKKSININDYFRENHEKEFFFIALELFEKSEIPRIIKDFGEIPSNPNKITEWKDNFEEKCLNQNIDEFNFLFVRLGIILELSLKGIALHKKYNIFLNKQNLIKYTEINKISTQTCSLNLLLNNINKLLNEKEIDKYKETFDFIKEKRNNIVHFAEMTTTLDYLNILKHFFIFKEYLEEVIKPLNTKVWTNKS